MKQRKIELLAPAGSFESMKAAIHAGADAIYIGGSKFGARAYADNLTIDDMKQAIDYAHIHGRSIYLTVNTLLKDKEMEEELDSYLRPYYEYGMDAFIVQDIGAFHYIHKNFPKIPIHASTQMTVNGADSAKLLKRLGATRIVNSRELSLSEIKQIKEEAQIEVESFIHGALCYCYSGQCLMSSFIGGRSGNRGRCAQPCRLPYQVTDGKTTLNREKERYVLSPKDMCTLDLLPEIIEAGIDSLKIEGRMKKPEYTAGVVRIYRKYINQYFSNNEKINILEEDRKELFDLFNRNGFNQGYYKQKNGRDMITLAEPAKRAGNETLFLDLKKYIDEEPKEKIKGTLILKKGFPAKIEVSFADCTVSMEGQVVESAQNQPMSEDRIRKQMQKTGNTSFSFVELNIVMGESLFVSIQALNELRRDALIKLQETFLSKFHRTSDLVMEKEKTTRQKQRESVLPELRIYIEQEGYFDSLLRFSEVDAFYLDINAFSPKLEAYSKQLHNRKKKCYLALPYVFRSEARKAFCKDFSYYEEQVDGFLVRNIEEFVTLKELGTEREIILDANVYTFNKEAEHVWESLGATSDTAPLELNERELEKRGILNSELVVYGYLPAMISAQCIHKTTQTCDKKETALKLKDRKNKEFPVKNICRYCYNIIYNSQPLVLLDKSKEIQNLAPKGIRLHFTIESKADAVLITERFIQQFIYIHRQDNPCKEFTRGHFSRGIE